VADPVASEPLPTPALPRNTIERVPFKPEGPTLSPAQPNPAQPNPGQPNPGQPIPGEPTPAARTRPMFDPQPQPITDVEAVQQELARSARQLQSLIDKNWQRYLELPDDVYRQGKRPSAKDLKAATARFDAVAADTRYRALAERPEFQATRDLLHAYLDALDARNSPKLALPPPPGAQR